MLKSGMQAHVRKEIAMKQDCEKCNSFRPIAHNDQFVKDHNTSGFIKLVPCPFCGKRSEAFLSCYTSIYRDHTEYHAAVHCFNCGCSGPTSWGKDAEVVALESANEWNKRWEHPSKKKRARKKKSKECVMSVNAVQKALYITNGFK